MIAEVGPRALARDVLYFAYFVLVSCLVVRHLIGRLYLMGWTYLTGQVRGTGQRKLHLSYARVDEN